MKKILITTALACSAAGLAFAQDTGNTPPRPPMPAMQMGDSQGGVPPMITTGDSAVDAQLRALQKEMEAKIRAIREEYQKKIKTLIGDRKIMVASTTEAMRQERRDDVSSAFRALQQDFEAKRKALQQDFETQRRSISATSTEDAKRALAQDFETRMKALQQDFEAKRKALAASSTQSFRREEDFQGDNEAERHENRRGNRQEEVRGTSTANPQGNAWGFFKRFFGGLK